jgi:hypothetical protein
MVSAVSMNATSEKKNYVDEKGRTLLAIFFKIVNFEINFISPKSAILVQNNLI